MPPTIHPHLAALPPSNSTSSTSTPFPSTGGTLTCHCATSPIQIHLSSNVSHNHFCGCSKCWKPTPTTLFSLVGVVPSTALSIAANGAKLVVVDPVAVIRRHACRECGVHMFGRIEVEHAFRGLDFVHVELDRETGSGQGKGKGKWQSPQFAAFVSSIVEKGFGVEGMGEVRGAFEEKGLRCYDVLSPELMDLLAGFAAEQSKKKASKL